MSTISVDYDVLNQRGSPAWFSDTFANIPTAGFKGRMFISTDTFAFYRDTGTGWDLIGGPGTGTLTGSGVAGQVSFFNGTQTITGNNNLFWDNVNSRLGINTATPGQPLDIHSTGNTLVQLNNTSTGNSNISFQNQDVAKWRVGNVYNAGANSFDIQNAGLSTNAISINSTTNNVNFGSTIGNGTFTYTLPSATGTFALTSDLTGYVTLATAQTITGVKQFTSANKTEFTAGISISNTASGGAASGNTTIGANVNGLQVNFPTGGYNNLNFASTTVGNTYTYPNATGTLSLTSDLGSYLPLAGGTLTGNLTINPTNTGVVGLDVASNTTRFRSDNLEGFKRQLEITMSSGTLVQLTAKGYLANYGTDMAFYTATTGGTNASPGIYITGTNNRVGIKTGTPSYDLDVSGTLGVSSAATFSSTISAGVITGDSLSTGVPSIIAKVGGGGNSGTYGFGGNTDYKIRAGSDYGSMIFDTAGAERMRITSAGYVGIGKTPSNKVLELYQDTNAALRIQNSTTGTGNSDGILLEIGGVDALLLNYESGYLAFGTAATERMRIFNNGNISIGTTTDFGYKLNLNGQPGANGYTAWTNWSDLRLKENVTNFDATNILEKIIKLRPVTYNYNELSGFDEETRNRRISGFIAQELKEVFPDMVGTIKKEDIEYYDTNLSNLDLYLVKAIQELYEKLKRNNIN